MKAAIMLVGTSLLLTGCGSVPVLESTPSGCDPTSSITVQHGPGRLVLMPPCIEVTEGNTVTVTFSPTPTMGARTKHKGPGNGWLNRRNDPDPSRIVIEVPSGTGGGGGGRVKPYDYSIYIEGVGMLDPRIVVQ